MFTGFRFPQSGVFEITTFGQPTGVNATLSSAPAATPPFTGAEPGEVHILPFPMPGDGPVVLPAPGTTPGFAPGSIGLPERIAGTEGDDRIEVPTGAVAAGLGGNDVFVLTPADAAKAGQPLAIITDFNEGDSLDLGKLGANARILATDESDRPWGADRVSIDADGDGTEDGFVILAGKGPDLGTFQAYPMPIVRGDTPVATLAANPFGGVNVGGPIAIGGGDAAGIRLMGDFHTFEGMDLSVV